VDTPNRNAIAVLRVPEIARVKSVALLRVARVKTRQGPWDPHSGIVTCTFTPKTLWHRCSQVSQAIDFFVLNANVSRPIRWASYTPFPRKAFLNSLNSFCVLVLQ
jgi:hypothetical protein